MVVELSSLGLSPSVLQGLLQAGEASSSYLTAPNSKGKQRALDVPLAERVEELVRTEADAVGARYQEPVIDEFGTFDDLNCISDSSSKILVSTMFVDSFWTDAWVLLLS